MALLFMDGFDMGDVSKKWPQAGLPSDFTQTNSTRFSAGKAIKLFATTNQDGRCSMVHDFTASSSIYIGAAIKIAWNNLNTLRPTSNVFGLYGDNRSVGHLYLSRTLTSAFALYRGNPLGGTYQSPSGTLLASTAAGKIDNNWHYIEMSATINSTSGRVVVRVDGSTEIDFTGNTKNGGVGTNIDAVGFSTGRSGFDTCDELCVDDLYICSNTGTTNNTFLGDVRVQTIIPTGAGSSTQFAPTGGANYANVAETPDSVATYNASSNVGDRDTYAMGDLASGTTSVLGVQSNLNAWKADAGTGNVKPAYRVGSTVYYDNTIGLGSSNAWYGAVRETNPDTSAAWTPSDVNGIEFGAEVA